MSLQSPHAMGTRTTRAILAISIAHIHPVQKPASQHSRAPRRCTTVFESARSRPCDAGCRADHSRVFCRAARRTAHCCDRAPRPGTAGVVFVTPSSRGACAERSACTPVTVVCTFRMAAAPLRAEHGRVCMALTGSERLLLGKATHHGCCLEEEEPARISSFQIADAPASDEVGASSWGKVPQTAYCCGK